ncbi:MAG: CHRD domain-containing protein [Burkholderiales bacterium]|nr:MAG: CHRD domain-containing protein [Burkholderiales bacterium]
MGCATVDKMTSSVTSTVRGDEKLTGAQEVPPVTTTATGSANIKVAADGAVSGGVTTAGVVSTMAHIHIGPAGQNGPVIVPLTKTGDNSYVVPAGAKLTPAQLAAYNMGSLYVNVHSNANKGGEIRAQLKP